MNTKKITLINASPHKEGNCNFMLKYASDKLNSLGFETEIIFLQDALICAKHPFCISCSTPCNQSCYKGTKLYDVLLKIENCDGLIFASPVFFGTMSAQAKCLFDKTRAFRAKNAFTGKVACAFSSGHSLFGGQEATIKAIHDCLLTDGFTIIGASSKEYGAGSFGVSSYNSAKDDKNAISKIDLVCHRFYEELM